MKVSSVHSPPELQADKSESETDYCTQVQTQDHPEPQTEDWKSLYKKKVSKNNTHFSI